MFSQEDKPKWHRSAGEISRETGIPHSTVRDIQLKCFNWRHAQLLSEANRIARLTVLLLFFYKPQVE